MTDAQLRILLSGLKARLDAAIDLAESTLPDDLMVTPEIPKMLAGLPESMRPTPIPFIPAFGALYDLQRTLDNDIAALDRSLDSVTQTSASRAVR